MRRKPVWERPLWLYVLFVAIVIAIISHMVYVVATCDGTAVRGLFKMECIRP